MTLCQTKRGRHEVQRDGDPAGEHGGEELHVIVIRVPLAGRDVGGWDVQDEGHGADGVLDGGRLAGAPRGQRRQPRRQAPLRRPPLQLQQAGPTRRQRVRGRHRQIKVETLSAD